MGGEKRDCAHRRIRGKVAGQATHTKSSQQRHGVLRGDREKRRKKKKKRPFSEKEGILRIILAERWGRPVRIERSVAGNVFKRPQSVMRAVEKAQDLDAEEVARVTGRRYGHDKNYYE